jgi:hypothetical protein
LCPVALSYLRDSIATRIRRLGVIAGRPALLTATPAPRPPPPSATRPHTSTPPPFSPLCPAPLSILKSHSSVPFLTIFLSSTPERYTFSSTVPSTPSCPLPASVPPRRERAGCIPAGPSNNSVDSTSATTMQMQSRRVEDPSSCAQKDTNWASMMDRGKESGAAATLGGAGE